MSDWEQLSVKAKNFKCFGEQETGLDTIRSINLVVGRNNSGKSSLLDLIECVATPQDIRQLGHKGRQPEVFLTHILCEDELKQVFQPQWSSGEIPGNHWQFGSRWIGKPFTWKLDYTMKNATCVSIAPPWDDPRGEGLLNRLAQVKTNPLKSYSFRRLRSERDLIPELDTGEKTSVASNGEGATTAIRRYLTTSYLPSELVEETLLRGLNAIYRPDATFEEITVREHPDKRWEVYLVESGKGRIPLSQSGSGLKTILLVLVFLYLIPAVEHKPLESYLFAFEELENNLHPAIQRRLFLYLRDMALKQGFLLFISTHSSVVIDLFDSDEEAQILHITHNGEEALVSTATTYVKSKGVLEDLGVRASDLLQSNAIIWVEGPSDRHYFNRWIELWSDGKLKEGIHYQCLPYGGSLWANLSATDPPSDISGLVNILRVNRNAIFLTDSDRRCKDQAIKESKKRIVSEVEKMGGLGWVTAGREVENYIPIGSLRAFYSNAALSPPGAYEDFSKYLSGIKPKEGIRFLRSKALYAEQIRSYFTKDALAGILDLVERLETACKYIRQWNGL